MEDKRSSLKKGEDAAKLSTVILLSVGILKGLVSFASGSVALLAGTIDSFSDVFSSVAVWVGLRIAKKKPTERFPYGYYKAETFALLAVSLIIVASSILIMKESFEKVFEVYVISFSDIALVVAAVSAGVYYLLAKYKARVGRQIGSQALISEGLHSMVDVYTSVLVFIGVFLGSIGFPIGEALIGFIIGAYVLARGLLYGKDAALVLMDVSPNPQMAKQMKTIAESVHGVRGTHDIRLRKSGPVFFGEMHLELQEGLSIERAHAISDEVEKRIKERFKDIELVTVHVGLGHKKKTRIAIPIVEDKGLQSLSSLHFGSAPYFAFIDVEEGKTVGFYVKENEGAKLSHKKGIQAANLLVEENVDVILVTGVGEGPFHILGDNLLRIYRLPLSTEIQEAVRLFNQNLLKLLTEPTEKQEE
ncbi:MAG: cation diffusion facilitator family transporter [Candidatus Bathyarchaeota archaeon]|nr:cation diffusion facilitator family transporter [Candidatus Bathyarchaeota archaeon]